MEYLLSDDERIKYKKILELAEPYTDAEIDAIPFDGKDDPLRSRATFAKRLLDEDDRRRAESAK